MININGIDDALLQGLEEASLESEGFTVNPRTLEFSHLVIGYAVSFLSVYSFKEAFKIIDKQNEWVQSSVYIGFWKDEKTGERYIDLSFRIIDHSEAVLLAKTFGQLAIYDFGQKKVEYL